MVELNFIKTFFVIILTLLPCFAAAEEFKYLSISFFGNQVGFIKVREVSNIDSLELHVDGRISSSPLKIFNGNFKYKTIITEKNSEGSRTHYASSVDATFKQREINYRLSNDRLIAVDVFPKREETKFTNPKQIDFEFIDPANAFATLLRMPCKKSFIIYDGRRIIEVTSIKQTTKLECGYIYKIEKGPGHLSPFNFRTFKISTFFDQSRNSAFRSMIVKTGPFKLILEQVP